MRLCRKNADDVVKPLQKCNYSESYYSRKKYYSIEEAQHLPELFEKEPMENYKYVCFYTLAIYTGFRLGELMGLERKDVNFDTNVITVNRTCLYSAKKLKELQDFQKNKVGTKQIETDRIFTKWNGLTLDRSAPSYYFKQFCKRTGMRYVSTNSIRHMNASLLINAGVDFKTV